MSTTPLSSIGSGIATGPSPTQKPALPELEARVQEAAAGLMQQPQAVTGSPDQERISLIKQRELLREALEKCYAIYQDSSLQQEEKEKLYKEIWERVPTAYAKELVCRAEMELYPAFVMAIDKVAQLRVPELLDVFLFLVSFREKGVEAAKKEENQISCYSGRYFFYADGRMLLKLEDAIIDKKRLIRMIDYDTLEISGGEYLLFKIAIEMHEIRVPPEAAADLASIERTYIEEFLPWALMCAKKSPTHIFYVRLRKKEQPLKAIQFNADGTIILHTRHALGRGAQKKVLCSISLNTGQDFAVSYAKKNTEAHEFYYYQREVNFYRLLSDTPYIGRMVQVVDLSTREKPKMIYIFERYKEGSLARAIQEKRFNAEQEQRRIALELLVAARALQLKGVVHCDLKPSNVMLKNGHIRIIDFGHAVSTEHPGHERLGTPDYWPPEYDALDGQPIDWKILHPVNTCKVDMWAIGCILAELRYDIPAETIHAWSKWGGRNPIPWPAKTIEEDPLGHLIDRSLQKNFSRRLDAYEAYEKYAKYLQYNS